MAPLTTRGIAFFEHAAAPLLDDTEMMSQPDLDPEVYTTLDLGKLAAGSRVTVLFADDRPDGLSLVHAWFGAGYRLPRHSHSADCLYYVVRGEARMGSRTIREGDGFFVRSGQRYVYEAGPDGVEVLEFRAASSFDMRVYDQTVERWLPIVAAAETNQDRWQAENPGHALRPATGAR